MPTIRSTNIKTLSVCTLTLLVSATLAAQTPTSLIPANSLNQINTLQSCLIMTAQVQAPGATSSSFPGFLSLFSPSSTWAYQCDGAVTGAGPGSISYVGTFEGGAFQPFAIGVTAIPGSRACGGANGPCMTSGTLFSTTFTAYGILHLDPANFSLVIDGINASGGTVGVLNQFGQYPLVGSIDVDTVANGGVEQRVAVQGICADPSSSSGFKLSACLNVDQWVSQ